jgi:hypothetical protein
MGGDMLSAVGSRLTYANVMATGAVFVVLGGGAYALTGVPDGSGVFHGCVSNRTGVVRVVKSASVCHKATGRGRHRDPGEFAVAWNQKGQPGTNGINGAKGTPGVNGTNGADGADGATKVTIRTATGPEVKEKALSTAGVECHPGEHMTGGGVDVTDVNFVEVVENYPNGPTQWVATVRNTAMGAPTLMVAAKVYAMCAAS